MQVFTTSMATRIDRGESLVDPRRKPPALRAFGRVEPDPFVNFPGVHVPCSALVRAGIVVLD
jgi:hypothetical protein